MSFNDIREFISKLEDEGELQHVKAEVDQDQELVAIMRKIQEADGPACLFENMKGTKFRMLSGAFYGHKKYALAIGAEPNLRALLDKLYDALLNPIDPVMVSTGACKENIDTGMKSIYINFRRLNGSTKMAVATSARLGASLLGILTPASAISRSIDG
jgi:UbiD family decarboxylase